LLALIGPEGGIDSFVEKRINDLFWLKLIYTDYTASTSLIGTGTDLGRFGQMLLNGGELDGVRILSKESTMEILYGGRPLGSKADTRLGNGTKTWYSKGVELIGHGGGGPGFALQYLLVPGNNLVVVVLTNGTIIDAFELSTLIASVFQNADYSL
jgi:CubicO group peptidase (beta-lactamase class C family)